MELSELAKSLTVPQAARLLAMVHKNQTKTKAERFGLYPIIDWGNYHRLKQLQSSHWVAEEVRFGDDLNDFNSLTPDQQKPLINAFGFFAIADGSIVSDIAFSLLLRAPSLEAQSFYICQLNNELIHAETYNNMISTLVPDLNRRMKIFHAADQVKSVAGMTKYIEDILSEESLSKIYVALACGEYLMFTPLFCIVFWYRAYLSGKLKQLIFANEQILKDEALHCYNGCENYKALPRDQQLTSEVLIEMISVVVGLVDEFADETLSDINLTDLTPDNVKQYIRVVADDLLVSLGSKPFYQAENPFPWMEFLRLRNKTNFYEGTVGEYTRFNLADSLKQAGIFSGENNEPEVEEVGEVLF